MARINPLKFLQQVRAEGAKISWPTRRETTVTSIMVFIMTMIVAFFFFLVDYIIRGGLTAILSFFG